MKPSKRIFLLVGLVSALVVFWLLPEINTARPVRYTRTYENTDEKPIVVIRSDTASDDPLARNEMENLVKGKIYTRESIEANATLKDINAKMYSRAIHYEEEILEIPLVADADSVVEVDLEVTDSVYYALVDTLRVSGKVK